MGSKLNSVRVNLRLAPGDYLVARFIADQRGVSVQEVLRSCIGEWAIRYRMAENSQKAAALMETFVAAFDGEVREVKQDGSEA